VLEDELSRAAEGSFRAVLARRRALGWASRLGRELLARHRDVTGLVAEAYPLGASATFGVWIEALGYGLFHAIVAPPAAGGPGRR
jgi:hypothetical protein